MHVVFDCNIQYIIMLNWPIVISEEGDRLSRAHESRAYEYGAEKSAGQNCPDQVAVYELSVCRLIFLTLLARL